MEEQTIPIEQQLNSFHHHLQCNERILLSARFGDGKTFFLNQFKQKFNKYTFITIYPINYQVEGNITILELIKRDIIVQFLAKGLITEKIDIKAILEAVFNKESLGELADFLSKAILLCGDPIGAKIPQMVNNVINVIRKTYDSYHENNCDAKNYLKRFRKQSGIYESDCYTQLIKEAIKVQQKERKETILVIEDLDRIDPEHIFRILNVFSAHIDRPYMDFPKQVGTETFTNKFGFDKIIIVCDYDNLKKLFVHRYGSEKLFGGYISKCITNMPFEYSLEDAKIQFALDKMSEISKMEKSFLRKIPEINQLLKGLSVREILALFNHIDDWITDGMFDNLTTGWRISKHCSLTRLLVVIKRLVSDHEELYEPIIEKLKYEDPLQTISLIDVMWCKISPNVYHAFYRRKDSRVVFSVVPQIKNNIIVEISIKEQHPNQYVDIDRNDYVEELFADAEKSVMSLGR